MYSFSEFCEVIKEKVVASLPEYEFDKVSLETVVKNNDNTKTGLTMLKKGSNVSPVIYLDEAYDSYIQGKNVDDIALDVKKAYLDAMTVNSVMDLKTDKMLNKDNLFVKIVNYDSNKERLKNVVHKKHLDLAITVRMLASSEDGAIVSATLDPKLLGDLGMSKEEVIDYAIENTKKLFPIKISTMEETLLSSIAADFGEDSFEYEMMKMDLEMAIGSMGPQMIIVSNEMGVNGATSILYEDEIATFAKDEDYVVLPSSIHEVIMLKMEPGMDEDYMRDMVRSINGSDVVNDMDVLSDNIYKYDGKTKKIGFCNDSMSHELNKDTKKSKSL